MEPEQLKPGEKVAVPESFWADQEKKEERRELIGEWRTWLSTKQQEALEANPYAPLRSRIPIEALKAFTAEERDALMTHEELEHSRLQPVARARAEQHRAYVAAGGNAEDFDDQWEGYGREIHTAGVAEANLERAKRASSPY